VHPGKRKEGDCISPWVRGRIKAEEADLEVEEADRPQVEVDGVEDGEEDCCLRVLAATRAHQRRVPPPEVTAAAKHTSAPPVSHERGGRGTRGGR
jgi:hypothetical protein